MNKFYQRLKTVITVLLFCIAPSILLAQSKISGTVTDENHLPVPGVSVRIKEQNKGTVTDIEGRYIISANEGQTLSFSFIGYATQSVVVGDKKIINISLTGDAKTLNEVVVTALGVKKETRRIGYAVQTVQGDALTTARDPNPIAGLIGKVAGVSVGPSAELLGNPNVLIRGNQVSLYVVDGFPINTDTYNISPDDIETYTILKGPAAAALYGSRAQYGAILITTKKGDKNKKGLTVDVNSSTVLNSGFLAFPRTQNSFGPGENTFYEFVDGKGGARGGVDGDYDVWGPYFNGQLIPQYDSPVDHVTGIRSKTPWLARGKDNLKNFLKVGSQTNNNVALGVVGENYTTRFSVSQQHQTSYIPSQYLNIANANLYASFTPTPKLTFEGNIDFNRQSTDNFPDVQYGPNSIIYNISIWTGADWDVNAPDIKAIWQPGKVGVQSQFEEYQRYHNPYLLTQKWTRGHYKNDTYGYLGGTYKFNDNLNLRLRSQIDTYNILRTEDLPFSAHPYGREGNQGDYREDRRDLFDNNTELILNYNYTIKNFLNLSGLVGSNLRTMSYNSSWVSTDYLNVPEVYAFSNSKNPIQATSFQSSERVFSYYASLDMTFGKYATLSATYRSDHTSAFQVPTTYTYPSVSVATVVSDYVKLPEVVSFLKLRGSYANVKADASSSTIGPAPFNSITAYGGSTVTNSPNTNPLFLNPLGYGSTYSSPYNGPDYSLNTSFRTDKPYNNQTAGYATDYLYAASIKTSTRVNYEEGFDIKFLQNRLGFSGSAFQYIDGPRIYPSAISTATGYTTLYLNTLKTKRSGYEGSLEGTPIKNLGGFTWNVLVNVATNKEVYKELPPGQDGSYQGYYKVGDRTDVLRGSKFLRTKEGQIINDEAGKPRSVGGQVLGNMNAKYNWSIANKIRYKNLSMGFQFDGAVGGVIIDYMHNKTMRGGANIETATGALGDARYQDWKNYGVTGYNGTYVGPGVYVSNLGSDNKPVPINIDSKTGAISNYSALQFSTNKQTALVQDYVSKYYNVDESNLMDKTFTKLREVTFSYDFPKAWLQKSFIQKISASLYGRNLLYFYKDKRFKDVDLDQYNGVQPQTVLQSPTVRSYGFNLNLSF